MKNVRELTAGELENVIECGITSLYSDDLDKAEEALAELVSRTVIAETALMLQQEWLLTPCGDLCHLKECDRANCPGEDITDTIYAYALAEAYHLHPKLLEGLDILDWLKQQEATR